MDLFREKIKEIDLLFSFPQYAGGKDPEKASSFLREIFYKSSGLNLSSKSVSFIYIYIYFAFLMRHEIHTFFTSTIATNSIKEILSLASDL
jgi:hypothetical protein